MQRVGMAKSKTIYLCQNCGYETPAWYGVCPQCGAYGSFEEGVSTASALKKERKERAVSDVSIASSLSNVSFHAESRFSTSIAEMDRVLGGGIVVGSLVLVGGEPELENPRCFFKLHKMSVNIKKCSMYPAKNPCSKSSCVHSGYLLHLAKCFWSIQMIWSR